MNSSPLEKSANPGNSKGMCGFLPGRNSNSHVCLDFSPEEIQTYMQMNSSPSEKSANPGIPRECVDFSRGEIQICMYVWISPREKSKHTCKRAVPHWRNPQILEIPGNVWISPGEKFKLACMFGCLPGRNPNIHANEQLPMEEIPGNSQEMCGFLLGSIQICMYV